MWFLRGGMSVGVAACVAPLVVALFFEACSTFAPALDTASRGEFVRADPRISMPAMIHPSAERRR